MKHLIPKQSAALTAGLSFLAALLLLVFFSSASVTASAAEADAAFTFSDTGVTASGASSGYEIEGTDLAITAAGTYTLTGTCADGTWSSARGWPMAQNTKPCRTEWLTCHPVPRWSRKAKT